MLLRSVVFLSSLAATAAAAETVSVWNLCRNNASVLLSYEDIDGKLRNFGPFEVGRLQRHSINIPDIASIEYSDWIGVFAVSGNDDKRYIMRDISGETPVTTTLDGTSFHFADALDHMYRQDGLHLRIICQDDLLISAAASARLVAPDVKHSFRSSVPVLMGPSGSSPRIASIPNGSRPVYVEECTDYTFMTGRGDPYCQVEYGDITGWVNLRYLGDVKAVQ